MKTSFSPAAEATLVAFLCAFSACSAAAQGHPVARVTRVIKDVKIIQGQAARPARVNEEVADGAVIRTAADSRAEVVLRDQFLARLAGNTFLSLGAKAVALNQGALLFEAPGRTSNAKITVGTVTIDAAGTTGIIERFGSTYVKILILQGEARVFRPGLFGDSVLLGAGQLLIAKPNPKALPEPVDFDIAQLYHTSVLTSADFRVLPGKSLIDRAIVKQKKDPELNATNLVIYGRGTLVNLVDPTPSPPPAGKPPEKTSPGEGPRK